MHPRSRVPARPHELPPPLLSGVPRDPLQEVGRLQNVTEDRTHFGAWAVSSSPLILGFDATDSAIMTRVWPVITNKEVLAVSQSWAGSAGRRVHACTDYQVWTKPIATGRFALFVLSNASVPISVAVNLRDVIAGYSHSHPRVVHARDLYAHADLGQVHGGSFNVSTLQPHDSCFVALSVHQQQPLPQNSETSEQHQLGLSQYFALSTQQEQGQPPSLHTSPPPARAHAPQTPTGAACDLLAACKSPASCPALSTPVPSTFDVTFTTTMGPFTVRVVRAWAPPFAARFWQLSQDSVQYMLGSPFYRVDRLNASEAFVVQFGYRGEPSVDQCWDARQTSNDTWSVHAPGNVRGTVAFSMGVAPPNANCTSTEYCAQGFSTNIFINYANNSRLDAHGFSIFGQVLTPGMEVVDRLYSGYGEVAELCSANASASHAAMDDAQSMSDPYCLGLGAASMGVSMDRLLKEGRAYWRKEKRLLDFVDGLRIGNISYTNPVS